MARHEPIAVTTILGLGHLARSAPAWSSEDCPASEDRHLPESRALAAKPEAGSRWRWKPGKIVPARAR
jgi:hypothetical protein